MVVIPNLSAYISCLGIRRTFAAHAVGKAHAVAAVIVGEDLLFFAYYLHMAFIVFSKHSIKIVCSEILCIYTNAEEII